MAQPFLLGVSYWPRRPVTLDVSPDEYYRSPQDHAVRLYQQFLDQPIA